MNMRLFRVLFGFFWFVGGVGNPLFSSGRISCEPLEEEASWSVCLQDGLDSLLQDELLFTSQLGLCVYDLTDDTLLYAYQAKQRMRPASTEKLVTAVTALSELGSDYRFATRLFYTGEIRGRVLHGDLYVVGGFDPCFGKEDLLSFGKALKESDVDSITGRLYADVSMKDTLQWGWGWCWDDDMPVLTPLLYGKKNNDYGQGFYCSESAELAREWACPREKDGILNRYCLETDGMRVFHLKGETEEALLIWISVLLSNRKLNLDTEEARTGAHFLQSRYLMSLETADLVIGYRADDSYFSFVKDFLNNRISLAQLQQALKLGTVGEQIVIKSQRAAFALEFQGYEVVDWKEYYMKRLQRGQALRNMYQELRQKPDVSGRYMRDIVRERNNSGK